MCFCGPLHMANQKRDDQLEHSYSSYVMIRDATPKTCRRRWMIGRRGERGSGISVLPARHDDDDDDIYICLHISSPNKVKQLLIDIFDIYHRDKRDCKVMSKPRWATICIRTAFLNFPTDLLFVGPKKSFKHNRILIRWMNMQMNDLQHQ